MPESFIVIGKIKYISKQDASPAFAASCIQEGATVLLIEEYGVMVIGIWKNRRWLLCIF